MNSVLQNKFSFFKFLVAIILTLSVDTVSAQEFPEYDELVVELSAPRIGVLEVPVAIKEEQAYLALLDLFDYFKLKTETDPETGAISGYILNEESSYKIDLQKSELIFQDKTYPLEASDYIKTPTTFYLRSDLFGEIFGLNTNFSFRSLDIKFDTEIDLPIYKDMRREKARKNLNLVKGIIEPDTIIERKYPFFKGGILDWGITTTQQTNGQDDNRFNLGLGTMIAGGETNILLNYSNRVPFTSRNQFYQWKYVNNESNLFKQVTAGKIFTGATSSLFAPVVGLQLTNSPLVNRRSYGTYILNDYTQPRWTVELYVNNVLIDFVQADASGFYSFDVPLMYGNTNVDLRFYGPYGEELSETRMINIPYNFVPKNELQYIWSAGVVEDRDNRKFSRFNLNYGLSNSITFGVGVEYLSEVESGEFMPFLNTSVRLASNVLFSGEYMYGVKGEGLLTYRTPSNMQFDLNYTKYHEDQTAINYNYLEEREFRFSAPIRTKNFTAFSRFSVNQILLPGTQFTTAQLLLSGSLFGISTNLTTYAIYNERLNDPTIYSTVSQTYRLPYQFLFSPQVQYDLSEQSIRNLNLELERVIFERGFLNLSYENNFLRNAYTFEVGLRYAFNFAQASATSRVGNKNTSHIQAARGSLRWDDNTGFLDASNRPGVARGGISIIPFLDLNGNGKMDRLEKGIAGLKLKSNPGVVSYSADGKIIRLNDLQPYVNLLLQIDLNSLDNIAWKIENPNIGVETVPNQYKPIYVPVKVIGEVSGYVYLKGENESKGIGRIKVNVLNEKREQVASVLSEGDGYFSYLGLYPGVYTIQVDQQQLNDIDLESAQQSISFEIESSEFGDIVDTIELFLEKAN